MAAIQASSAPVTTKQPASVSTAATEASLGPEAMPQATKVPAAATTTSPGPKTEKQATNIPTAATRSPGHEAKTLAAPDSAKQKGLLQILSRDHDNGHNHSRNGPKYCYSLRGHHGGTTAFNGKTVAKPGPDWNSFSGAGFTSPHLVSTDL